ncbi:hypothetical protein H6P81_008747 [Aristolochia fimbriata]|uniref:Uncharacterized protein n=1 Tax=Aristolochia fimbriata TaxID=158543 RepID=A0AAV7EMF5_ARIFI|nr:hypothetical protein H6P81_008747 [Aristolochia fimbriata]
MGVLASSSFLFVCLLSLILAQTTVFASTKRPYVVYMGEHSHGPEATSVDYDRVTDSHHTFLESYLGSIEKSREAVIYSYTKHINGFAAILDEEQAKAIAQHPDVISVFPDQKKKVLHTTKTWAFMGLEQPDESIPDDSLWKKARFGADVIIANLDTGVWPYSESFNDKGLGPVPSRWKGSCERDLSGRIRCNRKLIGMRGFSKGLEAAVRPLNATERLAHDVEGHGSHTLSTAGGAFVPNANILGYARGTAKGGAPHARVASYKIFWVVVPGEEGSTTDSDILAAFDQAIDDGVDVISNSFGGGPEEFFQSGSAIGSFHAVKKGISVVFSAGNSGPSPATVENLSPWVFTVAASTIDRSYTTFVKLGNGQILQGQSVLDSRMHQKYIPLINSVDVKLDSANATAAQFCFLGSLDPKKVKGKVVVCNRGISPRVEKGMAVKVAGGAGMILINDESSGDSLNADAHVLPSAMISYRDGLFLQSYMNSTRSPVAYVVPLGTTLAPEASPLMAAFSSQGPSSLLPEILKPDITAPGVSVLAAYPGTLSPTELPQDPRRVPYNIMSGTSMSCPHVAGVLGLLRTLHPDWSPAALRSAIMTTARTRDNSMEPMLESPEEKATPFSYGAGHIRPNRAQDPGLVYDLSTEDYLDFLCYWGYNSTQIEMFSKGTSNYKCPDQKAWSILDLNYPSITVPNLNRSTTVTRKLKNVGTPGTYEVVVEHLHGVSASVEPSRLTFEKMGEEKSYKLTLTPKYGKRIGGGDYVFGRIIWSDGVHYVRSPIVVS